MPTIVALFDSYEDADRAVNALGARGFHAREVGVVASEPTVRERREAGLADYQPHDAAEGAGEGALVGGLAGLLIGVGALALPGVGPLFVAGALSSVLASTLAGVTAGAVTGGLLGALHTMGLPHTVAQTYAEGVEAGGVMVSVTTQRTEEAEEILRANDGTNIHRAETELAR